MASPTHVSTLEYQVLCPRMIDRRAPRWVRPTDQHMPSSRSAPGLPPQRSGCPDQDPASFPGDQWLKMANDISVMKYIFRFNNVAPNASLL